MEIYQRSRVCPCERRWLCCQYFMLSRPCSRPRSWPPLAVSLHSGGDRAELGQFVHLRASQWLDLAGLGVVRAPRERTNGYCYGHKTHWRLNEAIAPPPPATCSIYFPIEIPGHCGQCILYTPLQLWSSLIFLFSSAICMTSSHNYNSKWRFRLLQELETFSLGCKFQLQWKHRHAFIITKTITLPRRERLTNIHTTYVRGFDFA